MSQLSKIMGAAEEQCRRNGVRLTEKRKHILSGLLKSNRALSAYELIDCCKGTHDKSMPAMSVYRILEFLQGEGLVHKLNTANKFVACSHIACDHKHEVPQFLICDNCQAVEEIGISKSTISSIEKSANKVGFHLLSPQLEINSICYACSDLAS